MKAPRYFHRPTVLGGLAVILISLASGFPWVFAGLEDELGRSETRVYAAPFEILPGTSVATTALAQRLERLGYQRVHRKPERPGEFFWGHETFHIWQREHLREGDNQPAELLSLKLSRGTGRILHLGGSPNDRSSKRLWLEPELVAEDLGGRRAARHPILLKELPKHVWKPLLAAEDARFFEHSGIDARGIARALLKNARAGKVVQGGSTLTQQLVKIRDLTSKRTVGRKVSEAMRALELEAEFDKQEILQAYLNSVYYGHIQGVSLYGIGTASRAFFSKAPEALSLAEAAMLAAVIQGPNRLSPTRNPKAVLDRQRWVLSRMEELEWATAGELRKARGQNLPRLRLKVPPPQGNRHFLAWLRDLAEQEAPRQREKGRGLVLETTLDAHLQEIAKTAIQEGLGKLRRSRRRLRSQPLSAALVALDGKTGEVLAYVAGDPSSSEDAFDRVRRAKRQPGSAVKPFVLLEAFESCGSREPLYPARLVADKAVKLPLPTGAWEPQNYDGRFRGPVSLREALVNSLNVPFVRTARWCGFEETARTVRQAGLEVPKEAPPSFVLGAIESTPLALAEAFTVFTRLGYRSRAVPLKRMSTSGGRLLSRGDSSRRKVAQPATAFLVLDLMRDAVVRGTAQGAALDDYQAWGKTGTSSDLRDAWFVGGSGSVVTAVWVGLDDGTPLGLSGARAALPLWHQFMKQAVPHRPTSRPNRPREIEEHWVDASSGLLLRKSRRDATRELFREDATPPRKRFLRRTQPVPIVY
ncbi:MAG: transglycosylase domain-containing protein [Deltaproteobacteria bacterium]|nr:transglycosylase domain-containing protein [Deltaproteobacteria bacterium]